MSSDCDHRWPATSAYSRRDLGGGLVLLVCAKCGHESGPFRRGAGMTLLPAHANFPVPPVPFYPSELANNFNHAQNNLRILKAANRRRNRQHLWQWLALSGAWLIDAIATLETAADWTALPSLAGLVFSSWMTGRTWALSRG